MRQEVENRAHARSYAFYRTPFDVFPDPIVLPDSDQFRKYRNLISKKEGYNPYIGDILDSKTNGGKIIADLKSKGLLDKPRVVYGLSIISNVAEAFLNLRTAEFQQFVYGVRDEIGGEEGHLAAAALVADLVDRYWTKPAYSESEVSTTDRKNELLRQTFGKVIGDYRNWSYENRPEVIPSVVRDRAHVKMLAQADSKKGFYAYLEEIFYGIGAGDLNELFTPEELRLVSWIVEKAKKEKKMEAGVIPVMADILGYDDVDTLRWITKFTQILWTAILTLDDTIDQSPIRGSQAALYVRQGVASGVRLPLLTMIKIARKITQREDIDNNLLAGSVLTMLDNLYTGDEANCSLNWENSEDEFVNNMRNIMQILAWFPRYAVQVNNIAEAKGLALADFMENYGILLLINNDFDDLEDTSHDAGDDIGARVNTFMYWFNKCQEIPQSDRDKFRSICENEQLRSKKRAHQELGDYEKQLIEKALELARKYRGTVARKMAAVINDNYDQADYNLTKAAEAKPVTDKRSNADFEIFKASLGGIRQKLTNYMWEDVKVAVVDDVIA